MQIIFRPIVLISITVTVMCYLLTMEMPTAKTFSEIANDTHVGDDVKTIAYISQIIGPFIFVGLAILPYVLIFMTSQRVSQNASALSLLSVATVIILSGYLIVFYKVFWFNTNPDAQDGVVLFIFPILAILFSAIGSSVARFMAGRN